MGAGVVFCDGEAGDFEIGLPAVGADEFDAVGAGMSGVVFAMFAMDDDVVTGRISGVGATAGVTADCAWFAAVGSGTKETRSDVAGLGGSVSERSFTRKNAANPTTINATRMASGRDEREGSVLRSRDVAVMCVPWDDAAFTTANVSAAVFT